jgi:hypothetical protein
MITLDSNKLLDLQNLSKVFHERDVVAYTYKIPKLRRLKQEDLEFKAT